VISQLGQEVVKDSREPSHICSHSLANDLRRGMHLKQGVQRCQEAA
jgi:hypothetical protein